MSKLFEPLTIRGTSFRNRIWVSPMCQYMCVDHDGMPHDWHLVNAGTYAAGGAGLVMVEATAVTPEGRITSECAGLWNDAQRDRWARVTSFVHSQGALAGIQLAHAGRKASDYRGFTAEAGRTKPAAEGGWVPVSASAIPCPGMDVPHELDLDEIKALVDAFGEAAVRSLEAGFDVIEIHAAHGYLLHSFLSPLSNERTDGYGGSLENRARLLLEIVARIRSVAPTTPLFVRFSGTDWADGGWTPEETAQVASWAADAGADFFDISSGGLIRDIFISVSPGYQVPLTETVRRLGGVKAAAVGKITTPEQAEQILVDGRADAIFLGRELTRDPHFALRAAHVLGETIDYVPLPFRAATWV
ncbi:NADH:flavin oxidoreductase/NADH oxidase [Lacisediminihabitans profunda]|uniref:NADH:flavin oxidoreductase/NADH oxidase n=1 Tax=Lacisediminihabitans profunda TaxID=2594790 RepID=A0A5C8UVF0_9MICO|nr:NADH:flavin oxidoreductase/NADH oxidase [Lacisediminihabitans profunda]TXN32641.1 NADH:flavin oxidoreductase/NADH oxidase [Lacisediminihabitans profunda]